MLLFEAKHQIDARLDETLQKDYKEHIPEYFEALEIASRCIQAQMELSDVLNDWDIKDDDRVSGLLCYEILEQFSIYHKEDEEDE